MSALGTLMPSALAVLRLMYSSTLWPLHRQFGGIVALENPAGINAGQAVCLRKVRSVAQQTSGHGKLAIGWIAGTA